jgi:uncharacterized membrane protein YfcA
MSLLEILAVAAAGALAGASNAIAGAGSLITFPTLIAVGIPQLAANVTSTVGLIPGAIGASYGYRDDVRSQRQRIVSLLFPSLLGAVAGTALLLLTPDDTFEVIVPVLVALSCVLLLFQPQLARRNRHLGNEGSPFLFGGLILTGAYAAYFGSAVSILLLALLGLFALDSMQRLNAVKVVLTGLMNLVAAIAFAFLAPVHWGAAVILMVSSLAGGQSGAWLALRIDGDRLRLAIAGAGLVVAVVLGVNAYG